MTTMLNTMGRFGAQTGAPVTKVKFDSAIQNDNAQHRDILVFAENSADIGNLDKLEPEVILEKVKGNLKSNFEQSRKHSSSVHCYGRHRHCHDCSVRISVRQRPLGRRALR
ncbi:MAG: cellulose biosynthesis cyclic di-GMP-binding regulatory protein BcsB [Parasutterella sp.]